MVLLVPVANGPLRDHVLDIAVELGEALGQELYIVHLVENEVADGDAKAMRDELRSKLEDDGITATVSLEYVGHSGARPGPRIGQEILEIAADVDVSHIVMGHSTHGLLQEVTRGSTAMSVVDNATVPVTIVPEHYVEE